MNEILLVSPNKAMEAAALDYRREHFENHEFELHGSSLLDTTNSYDAWLKQLSDNSNEETVNPDWVVSSTFFAVRKSDRKIIGMVDIRHHLNEFLSTSGGHIGYGIRPSERNRGYASKILNMALLYCKELDLSKVMLACYKDNVASSRTIVKCGGILHKEFFNADGKIVQIYWISL